MWETCCNERLFWQRVTKSRRRDICGIFDFAAYGRIDCDMRRKKRMGKGGCKKRKAQWRGPTRPRYEGMRVFISHRYLRRPRALHRPLQPSIRGILRSKEVHARFRRETAFWYLAQGAWTRSLHKQMSVCGENEINNQDSEEDVISEIATESVVVTLGDDNPGMQRSAHSNLSHPRYRAYLTLAQLRGVSGMDRMMLALPGSYVFV